MTASTPSTAPETAHSATRPAATVKHRRRKVPAHLIREIIGGIPFYYNGYKQVINKTKSPDEIMAVSSLQFFLKKYFYDLLVRHLDAQLYEVFVGEVGTHLEHKSNMGLDVAIFEMAMLPGEKFGFHYLDVAPKMVIEVDMKVSLDDTGLHSFEEFLHLKTQKLFEFGTERLLWVLTRSQKVVVAIPNEDWIIVDWNKDIEVWQGVQANIGKHLAIRGIKL